MALVDNLLGQHGTSRLMLMQARFQQRQQEEKEHKLFAMLEEQHDVSTGGSNGLLMPASRTHSNSSSASQQNSASSLSSSVGSSLASSLGSTGSGISAPGGKVRQMFEDRRNQVNGRPPVYAKNMANARRAPTNKGWDRSHPLDPLPVNPYDRGMTKPPPVQHRARGVSLERGPNPFGVGSLVRRSKSQYQVDEPLAVSPDQVASSEAQRYLNAPSATVKPRSMNSLLDDNQNSVAGTTITSKLNSKFGYNQSPAARHGQQARQQAALHRENSDMGNGMRHHRGKAPVEAYQMVSRVDQAAVAAAANEAARKLEKEKAQIQAEAKKREEELMNTIRQQQQQLQRLQQAAALAEQKAKAAAAATAKSSRKTVFTLPAPEESEHVKPNLNEEGPCPPFASRGWAQPGKKPQISTTNDMYQMLTVKPKPAPKPVVSKEPSPPASASGSSRSTPVRKSVFDAVQAGVKDGLVACSLCGRSFNSDRIVKHEEVCAKTKSKKRKVFDVTKMRVKGTEAETFVLPPAKNSPHQTMPAGKKPISLGQHVQQLQQQASPFNKPIQSDVIQHDGKKADWRKKHESFIEAIRAAKAVTKHIKAGGKISDLPPPPPSDTSDYIQCPHCGRRFSPGAADRHIPKCVNIKSNKPK